MRSSPNTQSQEGTPSPAPAGRRDWASRPAQQPALSPAGLGMASSGLILWLVPRSEVGWSSWQPRAGLGFSRSLLRSRGGRVWEELGGR